MVFDSLMKGAGREIGCFLSTPRHMFDLFRCLSINQAGKVSGLLYFRMQGRSLR